MLAINGVPDQIHILIGLNPAQAISDLVRDIKADSNEWVNKRNGSGEGSPGKSVAEPFRIPDLNWTESCGILD